MRKWNLTGPIANPLMCTASQPGYPISVTMAYVAPPRPQETIQKFKNRLYGVLLTIVTTGNGTRELRIARKYQGFAWQRVWTNVQTTGRSDPIISTWYAGIHEIIPANERLAAIHLTTTTSYVRCRTTDTLLHRLIVCEETSDMDLDKNQDSGNTTYTLQIHTGGVDPTPVSPSFAPQKQAAIIWIVAHQ